MTPERRRIEFLRSLVERRRRESRALRSSRSIGTQQANASAGFLLAATRLRLDYVAQVISTDSGYAPRRRRPGVA